MIRSLSVKLTPQDTAITYRSWNVSLFNNKGSCQLYKDVRVDKVPAAVPCFDKVCFDEKRGCHTITLLGF